jgi:hypothetical protein
MTEEVTRVLITVAMLLVSAGHTRSFDTLSLRESTKSALLAHVVPLMGLLAEMLWSRAALFTALASSIFV